jgi:segregation and condensation protein A
MAYNVKIEAFEGPLDLLLQLVEKNELEITNVSILAVTDPYVQHVREQQGKIPPEELADFLVLAAKLVYLKSKALLPDLYDPLLDEGPDLETQLRMYKQFVEAANRFGELTKSGIRSFGRLKPVKIQAEGFFPPSNATPETLRELYERIIRRLEPIMQLPKAAIERAMSIEEKIEQLTHRVKKLMRVSFHRFLAESGTRSEMIVSFLALLELIKQRIVIVKQRELFEDIHLESHNV